MDSSIFDHFYYNNVSHIFPNVNAKNFTIILKNAHVLRSERKFYCNYNDSVPLQLHFTLLYFHNKHLHHVYDSNAYPEFSVVQDQPVDLTAL